MPKRINPDRLKRAMLAAGIDIANLHYVQRQAEQQAHRNRRFVSQHSTFH